jgi:hypothetical protein
VGIEFFGGGGCKVLKVMGIITAKLGRTAKSFYSPQPGDTQIELGARQPMLFLKTALPVKAAGGCRVS